MLRSLFALMRNGMASDRRIGFLYAQLGRFVQAYAHGHFESVALYGRRIAEAFCIKVHGQEAYYQYDGLCSACWYLPCWSWRVYDYIEADRELAGIGEALGLGLSCARIWDDLTTLRQYGNYGLNTFEEQMEGMPMQPWDEVFVAAIRITLAYLYCVRTASYDLAPAQAKL